ncbi:YceI family protein [Shimia sp. MMG029]|uniref:YceI family protein n=1 Tax=Shimia sp. MMG029 TaxID=3021978 RepID=UPI0022FDEB8F|nr:YceI family protein [Shimia sp. MMG029]MDA5556481.1 YceI family protein [Shimia sp. MMG029]
MKTLLKTTALVLAFAGPAIAGGHETWKTVDEDSQIAFGSIKSSEFGEVHTFDALSGSVNEKGEVAVSIELGSVETNIDIRNERMITHIFKAADARAELTGSVDFDAVHDLEVGATTVVDFEGALSLVGVSADVEAELFVARLSEDRVLVTTSDMIMLSTYDLGIDAGVDKLKELASLEGITRVTPVTVRMIFEK